MPLDHDAIYAAYKGIVVQIDDDIGARDASGNIVSIDQTKVDAARIEIDKEVYKIKRSREYPDWRTQLEYIYDHGIDKWKTDMVDPIKEKYPKPSS